jgi:myo-inositol-1(or 4)-monophosphatase
VLDVLRGIGKTLRKELGGKAHAMGALERGAAGDKTYAVDRRAEEIILSGLEASGEPLSVISEEAGLLDLNGGGRTVIIDPVDGSKNAVTGVPLYCTSIAVADGGRLGDVELAYIINLASGDEYWAQKGAGAFMNSVPIFAQKDDTPYAAVYEVQNPGRDLPRILPLLYGFRRTRCLGAVALDLALLARGAASVFVTPAPSRSFDFAAGWLLVREAGGTVTDLDGKGIGEVELGLKRSSPILASGNEKLHEKALSLLKGL